MKTKSFFSVMFIALCMMGCNTNNPENNGNTSTESGIKDGAITNAVFQVNEAGKKVRFSQGNLQYKASDQTWSFAGQQYDLIGNDNGNISPSYDGMIDLFGWGTGNNPTLCATDDSEYDSFVDWGTNKISNGGNKANLWRTLTINEWEYIFTKGCKTKKLIRIDNHKTYGTICNGYLLLPVDFKTPEGINLTNDVFFDDDFEKMQANGAVLLPYACYRYGTEVVAAGGFYWSSTPKDQEYADHLFFEMSEYKFIAVNRNVGLSVRLVQDY